MVEFARSSCSNAWPSRGSMKLEKVFVILLLQEHYAVFEKNHVKLNGSDFAGIADFHRQGAIVN